MGGTLRSLLLSGLVLVSGCTTSRVEVVRDAPMAEPAAGGIVVLARRDDRSVEPEKSFLKCLIKKLEGKDNDLRTYPADAFLDALFPWFEPRTAPKGLAELTPIVERPAVTRRLLETGARYLVWVEGQTETTDGGGAISCTASPGGGGCFGFAWWDKDSSYEISVWDLEKAESVGSASAEALGTSYLPAVVGPIPLIARTQTAACDGLSQQLRRLLAPQAPAAPDL